MRQSFVIYLRTQYSHFSDPTLLGGFRGGELTINEMAIAAAATTPLRGLREDDAIFGVPTAMVDGRNYDGTGASRSLPYCTAGRRRCS